jgi:hypothetical protein
VHLCRAVAGIRVPYGPSKGGRGGWKTTPRAHKARIVPATSIMPCCSQEPVSQLPSRRPGAREHTRTHTHTHAHEFVLAEAGGGCALLGLGGVVRAGCVCVGGEHDSPVSFSARLLVCWGWAFYNVFSS